jgi:trafficking protein particle complex subunit 6
MAYRLANELQPSDREAAASGAGGGKSEGGEIYGSLVGGGAGTAAATHGGAGSKMDEDEERDAVFYRLEMLGYRVGQGLVERYVLCCRSLACFDVGGILLCLCRK